MVELNQALLCCVCSQPYVLPTYLAHTLRLMAVSPTCGPALEPGRAHGEHVLHVTRCSPHGVPTLWMVVSHGQAQLGVGGKPAHTDRVNACVLNGHPRVGALMMMP